MPSYSTFDGKSRSQFFGPQSSLNRPAAKSFDGKPLDEFFAKDSPVRQPSATTFDGKSRDQFFPENSPVRNLVAKPSDFQTLPMGENNPFAKNLPPPGQPQMPYGMAAGAVPQAPPSMPYGQMRSPMAAQASPQNASSSLGHHAPGSLAGRGPTPVGRSAYDPQRIAERVYRQTKDPRMLMQQADKNQHMMFGMQQQQMAAQQDAAQRQHSMQMFGLQQGAQDQRDAREHGQRLEEIGLQQKAHQQQTAEQRAYEENQYEKQAAARTVTGMEFMKAPDGSGFIPMVKKGDGSMNMAGGFMPSAKPSSPVQPTPSAAKAAPPHVKNFTRNGVESPYQWDAEAGGFRPVKFIDADGDGVPDGQPLTATKGRTGGLVF